MLKLTRPGIYGDFYHLVDGRIHQSNCTPQMYLQRVWLVERVFGFPDQAVGLTTTGQIVTEHPFVLGDDAAQPEVDEFLLESGFDPVNQHCWLWKSALEDDTEVWLGDARADNFKRTTAGLVPVDVRVWLTQTQDNGSRLIVL